MAEKVQLEIEVKGGETVGQASEKVKSLKTQLREMKAQLASGTLDTKTFNKLSKEAGELEDRIGDVNAKVKALASDTRTLDGFINVAEGITGGFAAAQGAMALFGSENEDVQKALLKVQGAVALLNGVQAIANMLQKESAAMTLLQTTRTNILTAAQVRYTAVVGGTTGALKALRIVGATLGIGLIVAAIGLLVANFDKVKQVVSKFIPSLALLGKIFKTVANAVTDFVGVTSDLSRALDKQGEAVSRLVKEGEKEIEIMEAQGATAQEIYNKKIELYDKEYAYLTERKRKLNDLSKEEEERLEELIQTIKLARITEKKRIDDEEDKAEKQRAENDKKRHDESVKRFKEAQEKKRKLIEDQLNYEIRQAEILGTLTIDMERTYAKKKLDAKLISENEYQLALLELHQREIQMESEKNQAEFDDLFKSLEAERDAGEAMRQQEEKDRNDYNTQVIEAENSLQQAKRDALNTGFDIAQQFTQKNKALNNVLFAVQKGLAIAEIIVNTQKEIAGYYAAYSAIPGGAAIATPLATAAKIRAGTSIATIAATTIGRLTGNNASGGGGSISGGAAPQPQIGGFFTGNNSGNQRGLEGQNIRVYVAETDIRRVSNKVTDQYSQATVE